MNTNKKLNRLSVVVKRVIATLESQPISFIRIIALLYIGARFSLHPTEVSKIAIQLTGVCWILEAMIIIYTKINEGGDNNDKTI